MWWKMFGVGLDIFLKTVYPLSDGKIDQAGKSCRPIFMPKTNCGCPPDPKLRLSRELLREMPKADLIHVVETIQDYPPKDQTDEHFYHLLLSELHVRNRMATA